jgi:hypothetical protein
MSTSTDTRKTYPLPPAPTWAVEDYMEEDRRSYTRVVGVYDLISDYVDGSGGDSVVQIIRRDEITSTTLTEGETFVFLLDRMFTPAQARALAPLLVQAADLADQG